MTSTTEFVSRMEDYFLGHGENADLWAEDIVIEAPFAPPGRPKRYVGRQAFLDATRESRRSLPVRFEAVQNVTVHDAGDTLVMEYELAGTVLTTGRKASARFIAVARVRADGRVTLWREYQDTRAIAEALGDYS
jgi:uncharacterized protein